MSLGYLLTGFLAVCRFLFRAREPTLQTFDALLRFAQVARIVYSIAITIGQKRLETQVNAYLRTGRDMFYTPLSLYRKLAVVAVGTFEQTYSLNLLCGEGFNLLLGIAH